MREYDKAHNTVSELSTTAQELVGRLPTALQEYDSSHDTKAEILATAQGVYDELATAVHEYDVTHNSTDELSVTAKELAAKLEDFLEPDLGELVPTS